MALKAAIAYSQTILDECWESMMPLDKELSQYLKELESKRKAKVEQLLSLGKKEQKEYVGHMVARYFYYNREHLVDEFPFEWFSAELKELNRELLEVLFIHALTIFGLYRNTLKFYDHVEVKNFVRCEAEKFGMSEAFEKYFDPETTLSGILW